MPIKKNSDNKKIKSWTQLIKEMSMKRDATGQTHREAIVKTLLKKAKGGEQWAIKEVLDRMEGKPVQLQRTDLTTDGQSLNANVTFVDSSTVLTQGQDANMQVLEYSNAGEGEVSELSESQMEGDAQPLEKNESDNCDTDTPNISQNQLDTSKDEVSTDEH